tara:strand:+ start:287 stop:529 length:243 start_codon:yes stop_codon:yes gene_type:complete
LKHLFDLILATILIIVLSAPMFFIVFAIRQTSLDGLPQLISILRRSMTFAGLRPALYNQEDRITLRLDYELHKLLPGLTV